MRGYAFRNPFAVDDEQRLAFRALAGEHQIHPIHQRRLTDQTQHLRNRHPYVRGFQQQPARLGRGRKQTLAARQRLVDLHQFLGARRHGHDGNGNRGFDFEHG